MTRGPEPCSTRPLSVAALTHIRSARVAAACVDDLCAEEALASVVYMVRKGKEQREELVEGGAIPPLVRTLVHGTPTQVTMATAALAGLASNPLALQVGFGWGVNMCLTWWCAGRRKGLQVAGAEQPAVGSARFPPLSPGDGCANHERARHNPPPILV